MMDRPGNRSLVLDLEAGESLQVTLPAGDAPEQTLSITVLPKSGRRSRLRVVAAENVRVQRETKEKFPAMT